MGYGAAGRAFGVTQDVDAILPSVEMTRIEADRQFWEALDAANQELASAGLYMTHLFTDEQVILTAAWLSQLVPLPISPGFLHLQVLRPSGLDLVLTKMMRNDPQDLDDIHFLITQENLQPSQLTHAFATARLPPVPEIVDAFAAMQPKVLAAAKRSAK